MGNFSQEYKELLNLLDKKEKMVAMLAPSFPIVFEYPQIVDNLKKLGFSHVFEVSRGAIETNCQVLDKLVQGDKKRLIAGPCPTVVRLIRSKYPHLIPFIAEADSPMIASAKLVLQKFPNHRPVFIGPCLTKKLEASEDHPDLNILVLTYFDLQQIFDFKKVKIKKVNVLEGFDFIGSKTRLYPISGGLSQSSDLNQSLTDEELDVVSGPVNCQKALEDFPKNRLKLLDILFCDGGCINGPGIKSELSLEERRIRVIQHWAKIIK